MRSKNISFHPIYSFFVFMWGFFAPIPIAKIGSFAISNYFMIAAFLITSRRIHIRKQLLLVPIWSLLFLINNIINRNVLPDIYLSNVLTSSIKLVLTALITILCVSSDSNTTTKSFFRGIYYVALAQCIWMLLEYVFWYAFSTSLNQVVFGNFLHISIDESWVNIKDGLFRPSGFGWDSAPLGLLMLFGYLISYKTLNKWLFAVCVFFSTSRQAIVCLIIIWLIYAFKNHKIEKYGRRNIIRNMIIAIAFILLAIILLNRFGDVFQAMIERLSSSFAVSGNLDSSAFRHISYYNELVYIFKRISFFQILFGAGTLSVGYYYSHIVGVYRYLTYAWTVESDFINAFLGSGLFWGISYYYILLSNILRTRKVKCETLYNMSIAILCSGIMYSFLRSVWPLEIALLIFTMKQNEILNCEPIINSINK